MTVKTENNKSITGGKIKALISTITSEPSKCGFEVYIITSGSLSSKLQLKKMYFIEKEDNNLRQNLKKSIFNVLSEKFNAADANYVSADRIADEQNKFYIVKVSKEYDPLSVLKTEPQRFCKKDISNAKGIAFSIRSGENHLWAYQHLWSIMVPNKSNKNFLARIISGTEGNVFEEMKDTIITFAKRIDLLVIDDNIITSDYKLLQKYFDFQGYIRIRANKIITAIEKKDIVANVDKLKEYVMRGDGNPKYAKKMMRIADSPVLQMDSKQLLGNIHNSTRWNGKLKEKNEKFVLDTYVQVENLIDLLDERYTRSDITGKEYDTDVKQLAD